MKNKFNSSGVSKFSITWRRLIHKPITSIFRLSLKYKIKLLRNDFKPNNKPTIFAATHVFYDDIPIVCCSVNQNAYLLLGVEGTENTPCFIERFALYLNGVILVNRGDKESRFTSIQKTTNILNNNGNVLMFPEGAWNFSPNQIIQNLNWGVIRLAEQASANIIPIAVDIVCDNYCVIIGEKFDYSKYDTRQKAIEGLQDEMACLAWELMEMKPIVKRESLTDNYWLEHIKTQYVKMPLKDQAKEESYMFRPKGEVNLGELLADMFGIKYKSMASDYETHKRIERLIDNWTKPIKISK